MFTPQWTGAYERWTEIYLLIHHWKIRHEMDREDAVQECAKIWTWCLKKTTGRGGRIDNDRWFMSYYQRAVQTWLITTANKDTKRRNFLAEYQFEQQIRQQHQSTDDVEFAIDVTGHASPELLMVLDAILTTPSQWFRDALLRPDEDRIWSRRLCRLCGISVNENVITELRNLLKKT